MTSSGDAKAKAVTASLAARAWSVSEAVAVKDRTEQLAKERIDRWVYEAQKGGRTLGYKGKKDGDTVGLLKSPGRSLGRRSRHRRRCARSSRTFR